MFLRELVSQAGSGTSLEIACSVLFERSNAFASGSVMTVEGRWNVSVPDFSGKTLRSVFVRMASALEIDSKLSGSVAACFSTGFCCSVSAPDSRAMKHPSLQQQFNSIWWGNRILIPQPVTVSGDNTKGWNSPG